MAINSNVRFHSWESCRAGIAGIVPHLPTCEKTMCVRAHDTHVGTHADTTHQDNIAGSGKTDRM